MEEDRPLQAEQTTARHNTLLDARSLPAEGPAGASRTMMVLQEVLPQGYIIAETVATGRVCCEEHVKTRSSAVVPANGINGLLA